MFRLKVDSTDHEHIRNRIRKLLFVVAKANTISQLTSDKFSDLEPEKEQRQSRIFKDSSSFDSKLFTTIRTSQNFALSDFIDFSITSKIRTNRFSAPALFNQIINTSRFVREMFQEIYNTCKVWLFYKKLKFLIFFSSKTILLLILLMPLTLCFFFLFLK